MEWSILAAGAFLAGLIDAVVGGGGLIQLPLLLAVFPGVSIPVLFGTNKMSSIAGTASALWQYSRKIRIPWKLALPASMAALIGAAAGAATVSYLPPAAMRPMVLVLLIVVGAYTWFKPQFGTDSVHHERRSPRLLASLLGGSIGFYDGFFGPGTGSFLIFGFVRMFGMDMLHASASAKLVNFATNFAALSFFLLHEGVMWQLGLVMACANILGAQVGTRLAVRHGNHFIRWLLLIVVVVLIIKLSLDLLK